MAEFLAMGGYAAYVWPAWLVAAVVVLGISLDSGRRLRDARRRLARMEGGAAPAGRSAGKAP